MKRLTSFGVKVHTCESLSHLSTLAEAAEQTEQSGRYTCEMKKLVLEPDLETGSSSRERKSLGQ